jgi:hypothetical protein
MTNVLGLKRLLPCVFLVALTCVAASADIEQNPKLSQRPTVAMPMCSSPKPYRLESWQPGVNRFLIALAVAPGDSLQNAFAEAKRLSEKYKFEGSSPLPIVGSDTYITLVDWLEPEKVAALRCEGSIVQVGFSTFEALPQTYRSMSERVE